MMTHPMQKAYLRRLFHEGLPGSENWNAFNKRFYEDQGFYSPYPSEAINRFHLYLKGEKEAPNWLIEDEYHLEMFEKVSEDFKNQKNQPAVSIPLGIILQKSYLYRLYNKGVPSKEDREEFNKNFFFDHGYTTNVSSYVENIIIDFDQMLKGTKTRSAWIYTDELLNMFMKVAKEYHKIDSQPVNQPLLLKYLDCLYRNGAAPKTTIPAFHAWFYEEYGYGSNLPSEVSHSLCNFRSQLMSGQIPKWLQKRVEIKKMTDKVVHELKKIEKNRVAKAAKKSQKKPQELPKISAEVMSQPLVRLEKNQPAKRVILTRQSRSRTEEASSEEETKSSENSKSVHFSNKIEVEKAIIQEEPARHKEDPPARKKRRYVSKIAQESAEQMEEMVRGIRSAAMLIEQLKRRNEPEPKRRRSSTKPTQEEEEPTSQLKKEIIKETVLVLEPLLKRRHRSLAQRSEDEEKGSQETPLLVDLEEEENIAPKMNEKTFVLINLEPEEGEIVEADGSSQEIVLISSSEKQITEKKVQNQPEEEVPSRKEAEEITPLENEEKEETSKSYESPPVEKQSESLDESDKKENLKRRILELEEQLKLTINSNEQLEEKLKDRDVLIQSKEQTIKTKGEFFDVMRSFLPIFSSPAFPRRRRSCQFGMQTREAIQDIKIETID